MIRFLFLTATLLFPFSIQATTWKTRAFGFWNSPSIWVGFQVPTLQAGDSLLVNHPVVVQSRLEIPANCYVGIFSEGGLCGHQFMSVLSGSKLENHGILNMDTLHILGAQVFNYTGGFVTLTLNAQVSGIGSLWSVQGGMVYVGGWFDCPGPQYLFAATDVAPQQIPEKTLFYPNPAKTSIAFREEATGRFSTATLFNAMGQWIAGQKLSSLHPSMDLSHLPDGVYHLVLSNGTERQISRVLVHK